MGGQYLPFLTISKTTVLDATISFRLNNFRHQMMTVNHFPPTPSFINLHQRLSLIIKSFDAHKVLFDLFKFVHEPQIRD